MLFLSVLASLIAATATTALFIPRQSTQVWSITNFLASGSRFSITTTYSFVLSSLSPSSPNTTLTTTCHGSISTQPTISYLPITACTNPIFTFNFQSAPLSATAAGVPGFNLEIWEANPEDEMCNPGSGCVWVGVKWFDAGDVETVVDEGNPNGDFDYLNAPGSFGVVYEGVHI